MSGAESNEFLGVEAKVVKDGGVANGKKKDAGADVVIPEAGAEAGEDASVPEEDAATPGEDAAVPEAGPVDGGTGPGSCDGGSAFREESYGLGFAPAKLLFGDVNGDGRTDVVAANPAEISVLLGSSSGQLGTGLTMSIPSNGVAVADLDADGSAEIVVSDGSAGWTEVRYGGELDLVRPEGFPNVDRVVSGDFTCDGRTDLAFMRGSRYVLVVPGGDPGARFEWTSPWFANAIIGAADFDGDSCTDLLLRVGNIGWPVIYFLPSPLQSDTDYRGVGVYPSMDVADFDGDALPEVVGRSSTGGVGVWSADTNTRYELIAFDYYWSGLQLLRSVAAPPALVITSSTGAVNIYESDGTGYLVPGGPQIVLQFGAGLKLVKTTDLDGDGVEEIFAVETTPEPLLTVLRTCN